VDWTQGIFPILVSAIDQGHFLAVNGGKPVEGRLEQIALAWARRLSVFCARFT
jgi:hypothetical protein